MRLTRVIVTNHSRLADSDFEVREHLVLVGANDVGKSSLLRCLDLLLGASTAQLYARLGQEDLRETATPMIVEGTLADLTVTEEASFPDEVTVNPSGGDRVLVVRLEVDAGDPENLSIQRSAPAGGTGRQLSRDQISAIGWRMIGATRAGIRDFRDDHNAALDDILAKIDLGAERASLAKLAESFQHELSMSNTLEQLRDSLAKQLSKATPTAVDKDDLAFTTGATATDDLLSDVRLQLRSDGVQRNLTEQSDGARALFAMALYDLVSASANMVAIDEPETHLHPTSQRSLARLLRDGANQKIIATHSPNIVGRFEPEQVAVIQPGGAVVQPAEGFLSAEQKLQAHWWVQDKLEPLTARRVVFVEGPSDRIVLMRAAALLDFDLDRSGVSILEGTGKGALPSVLALFGRTGFAVPMTLLIDEDARETTAKLLAVNLSDLETQAQYPTFVSTHALEDEYIRAIGLRTLEKALMESGFWSRNQLQHLGPETGQPATHESLLKFCKDRKVQAALVVERILTAKIANAITSVAALITSLRTDA